MSKRDSLFCKRCGKPVSFVLSRVKNKGKTPFCTGCGKKLNKREVADLKLVKEFIKKL